MNEGSAKWEEPKDCNWAENEKSESESGYSSVKKTIRPRDCISENQRFRLVTVATYGNIFKDEKVAPWTLWAHRYLGGPNVKATYLMLAEPGSVIHYPSTIYAMRESIKLKEIKAPPSSLYNEREWNDLVEKIEFLEEGNIKKSFAGLQETIEEIQQLVSSEHEQFKMNKKRRQLIFGINSDSVYKLNESNLVVFVESS